jgi:hypothetical protein
VARNQGLELRRCVRVAYLNDYFLNTDIIISIIFLQL